MKYEFGAEKPEQFRQYWPGQYDFFSYMEYACAIPQPLFAITTRKADGKPNINFHSWSCFQGEKGGFFAILAGLCQHTHTYETLRRDGAFCVNFLSKRYYDALIRTVEHNGPAEDEFAVGGFIEETAWTVAVPRIAESFLTLECKCERIEDLSGEGLTAMVIGRVTHMAMAEDYAKGFEDQKYSGNGFFYLIHTPKDLETGEGNHMGIATLCPERKE